MYLKNSISPLLLFLSLFAFLFLGSCEKDVFLPESVEKVATSPLSETNQQPKMIQTVASEGLQQSIKASLLTNPGKPDKGKDAEFSAILDVILASPASKTTSDDLDDDVYAYFVPTEDPSYVVNAIFSAKGDALTGGYVHVFRMTSEFAAAFNSFSADFSQFEGELGILPLVSLKELIYEPKQKNGDDDCFTYILSLDPKIPGGGGGGNSGDGGNGIADGPRGTSGPIGGVNGASNTCTSVIITECTCSPHHTVASSCSCDDHGGQGPVIIAWTHACPDDTFTSTTSTPEDDKNISLDECAQFLTSVGIIPRSLSLPDVSAHTLEQISASISKTSFNENAVMDMIDPSAFEACYDSGAIPASCITAQVKDYLKDMLSVPSDGTLQVNYGTLIDNIQDGAILADLFHAVYGSSANEDILVASRYALAHLSDPAIISDLSGQILHLAQLSQQLEDSFEQYAPYFSHLVNKLCGVLSPRQIGLITQRPEDIRKMSEFINRENNSPESIDYVHFVTEMIEEDEERKWDRFEELYELLKNNPDAFFEDCGDEVEPWVDLASFVPSGDALDKLERLDQYTLQTIQNADSKLINLDRFAIKIDVLPLKISGERFTPSEFFDHIRRNLTTLAPKFGFDDDAERDLWLSDDPYTAISNITLLDGRVGNIADGDVMCTQYSECCWVFSTIRGLFYESGDHPVSGNRKFGYNVDEVSGEFEFYIQGADRVTRFWHNFGFTTLDNVAYDQGRNFWNDFMQELNDFVVSPTSGGSVAEISEPVSLRPNWNAIKDKLISDQPLTIIPCGN